MANELGALSEQLAAVVKSAEASVVAVHARPRVSSSGVFWRPGIIVTAEHTIRKEEDITVTLAGGAQKAATLVGSDPGTDVAVLRLEGGTPGPRAASTPKAGNMVLTLGRSKDSGINATMGIVSAVSGASWRTWRGGRLDDYIRLDLTLYPGCSGGVVVNTEGQAIGIATSVLSRIAGVAIPASTVDLVVDEILARGHVASGFLGVGLQPVTVSDHQRGLIVLSLESDGPAAKAGLLVGDILRALGAQTLEDTGDVQTVLESHRVGQAVEVTLLRGGVEQKLEVTIGERPRRTGGSWGRG